VLIIRYCVWNKK